jgi:hypothetical protein
MLWYNS